MVSKYIILNFYYAKFGYEHIKVPAVPRHRQPPIKLSNDANDVITGSGLDGLMLILIILTFSCIAMNIIFLMEYHWCFIS